MLVLLGARLVGLLVAGDEEEGAFGQLHASSGVRHRS
jgi:hypothetical protein